MATAPAAFNSIALSDLTDATLGGDGVFDVLMQANKAHLDDQFNSDRIKGPEYATVYLGSLQAVMGTALQFLLQKNAANQDALLKAKQLELAEVQLQIAQAQLLQTQAQTAQIQAQTSVAGQQLLNLQDELLTAAKQRDKLDKEALNLVDQGLLIQAQTALTVQQKTNLVSQELQIDAETALTVQKTDNALIEKDVLIAQKCKLQVEFDVLNLTKTKTTAETNLLQQKIETEKAQITALGVDADSVVGRQKALYVAQTNGFTRDAEQKAAKLMVDTWNVRRTTDEGTQANTTNKLDDSSVGRAVTKLLDGIAA